MEENIEEYKINSVKITKGQFLNEIKEMIEHNIFCYSSTNLEEFEIEKQKLNYINEIIKNEKQKDIKKKFDKEVR